MKDERERSMKRNVKDQFYRIKLCPMLTRPGGCTKGDMCCYAHESQQIERPVSLRKTKICKQWRLGLCRDPQCKYAHGEHELRSTESFYKTSLCKFYANGSCPQGQHCRHAHGENELKSRGTICQKVETITHAEKIIGCIPSPSKDDINMRANAALETITTSDGSCSDDAETFTSKTGPTRSLSSGMLTPELNSSIGDETPFNESAVAQMLLAPTTKMKMEFSEPSYVETIHWMNLSGMITTDMIAESFASFYEE